METGFLVISLLLKKLGMGEGGGGAYLLFWPRGWAPIRGRALIGAGEGSYSRKCRIRTTLNKLTVNLILNWRSIGAKLSVRPSTANFDAV